MGKNQLAAFSNGFKLRNRLTISILSVIAIIYLVTFGIILNRTEKSGYRDAVKLTESVASEYASQANVTFNSYSAIVKTLGDIFENYKDIPEEIRRDIFSEMLRNTLKSNNELLSVWSIWETNSIDSYDNEHRNKTGSTILGNFRYEYYKLNDEIKLSEYIEQDSTQVLSGKLYSNLKKNHKELIVDPYYYSYSRKKEEEVLLTNIVRPIMAYNKFSGIIGIDFLLQSHQQVVDGINAIEQNSAILISNGGLIVAYSKQNHIGERLTLSGYNFKDSLMVYNNIREGKLFSINGTDNLNNAVLMSFAPIKVGKSETPWSFCIAVPLKVILSDSVKNFRISLILGIAGLVIMFILITLIARTITRPIEESVKFSKEVSSGNLMVEAELAKRKDETGQLLYALSEMVEKIRQIVSGIAGSSENVHSAGSQLDLSSQVLSQGSSELASSVEEVSATIEEMFESIRENSEESSNIASYSEQAMVKVRQVSEMSIKAKEASRTISNKILIINDIAFQTNLLALNAAVEAARAGDKGKGFAVVATEVRKLAERSKQAADEIINLAKSSLELSEKTGTLLLNLIPEIQKIAETINHISTRGQEQVAATSEINNNIQQINNIAQQNAATSEEIASSAEELVAQADYLKETVSYFKI